jgi:HlyD family secretion protein
MRLRILAAVLLLVTGVAAVGYVGFVLPAAGSNSTDQLITSRATVTDVVQQAVATGTVGPHATYAMAFGVQPQIVSGASTSSPSGSSTWKVTSVSVSVGDAVTSGDVLAVADDSNAQIALQIAQANLTAAQAKLSDDEAKPTASDRSSANNQLAQARQSLSSAKQDRTDTERQNALTLQSARNDVTTAQKQLKKDRRASAPSTVISADKTNVSSARSRLTSTEAQVTASNHQADQRVTSAQLSLTAAQESHDTALEPASDSTLASDRASVASAQQSVDDAQTSLDGASIVAPADGIVVAVNIVPGVNAPASDAVSMEVGPMEVSADFAEADLPALKVGQDATVTVTAIDQQVSGTLSSITPTADSSGNTSVVTYAVLVTLPSAPDALRSGMSADVSITTASATGVVAVPSIALQGTAGNYSVRILDSDGAVHTASVQVGLLTSTLAEIQSGVSEGDEVVVGTTAARQGSSSTTGTNLNGLGGGGVFINGGGSFPRGGAGR